MTLTTIITAISMIARMSFHNLVRSLLLV